MKKFFVGDFSRNANAKSSNGYCGLNIKEEITHNGKYIFLGDKTSYFMIKNRKIHSENSCSYFTKYNYVAYVICDFNVKEFY